MAVSKYWLVPLLASAFLLARLTGTHLHLCFDGAEPWQEVHTSDSAHLDHHPGDTRSHDDVDLDPLGVVLAKSVKLDSPPLALFAAALWILLLTPTRLPALSGRAERCPRPLPRFFTPPLRAPPV